ncbi:biogenesis of lysosome-related organelles complex 1 subunit 5 isoform X1 [Amia ocellicauda]|uniref:biogenesis of lysosome-related organelles complex 1 subunit 5 isoform X1 n=1 Tax=Amia ocellicauda TaxID=2972642 RepID=UPI0034649907
MEKIAKDVGDVQSRLLDHRPVIQGEIRYFVREFEEKRGFRETRLLDNLNKMVVETNEQAIPKCAEAMHSHLCDALTRLEAANHMIQRIQQRELEAQQTNKSRLQLVGEKKIDSTSENNAVKNTSPQRESSNLQACEDRRKAEWEEFMKEQSRRREAIDEEQAKAVGRLSAQYSEMEKDLAKFSTF